MNNKEELKALDDKLLADIQARADKATEAIQFSRKTHVEWADFFRKHPKCQYDLQYAEIGDLKHHESCIKSYDAVLKSLKDIPYLLTALSATRGQLREKTKDEIHALIEKYGDPHYKTNEFAIYDLIRIVQQLKEQLSEARGEGEKLEDLPIFGKLLNEQRVKCTGLTMHEVSRLTGVSVGYISKIEGGLTPRRKIALKLAKCVGLPEKQAIHCIINARGRTIADLQSHLTTAHETIKEMQLSESKCPNCGECRTETEINDHACYACNYSIEHYKDIQAQLTTAQEKVKALEEKITKWTATVSTALKNDNEIKGKQLVAAEQKIEELENIKKWWELRMRENGLCTNCGGPIERCKKANIACCLECTHNHTKGIKK